jgi:hypothetical protein
MVKDNVKEKVMTEIGKPKTMYLHATLGKKPRIVTLVHTLGKTEEGNFYAHVGYSICNREFDQFSKKIGRTIAQGRMENLRTTLVFNYPEGADTWLKRRNYMVSALASGVYGPRRLSSAVKRFILQEVALNGDLV